MPATVNGGGDQLARGMSRAQFRPAGSNKTQEEWDAMFADYNHEEFLKKETPRGEGEKEISTLGLSSR